MASGRAAVRSAGGSSADTISAGWSNVRHFGDANAGRGNEQQSRKRDVLWEALMGKQDNAAVTVVASKVALLFGVPAILALVGWLLASQLQLQITMVEIQAQLRYQITPKIDETASKLRMLEQKIDGGKL